MPKKIFALGLGIVITSVALVLGHGSGSSDPPSQSGLRGHWTATQKAEARSVLTASPVSESSALAACVVSKISEQNDYSQFTKYVQMAKADDFQSPDNDQSLVIANLMADALSCPQEG